jgi:hypothetical protein
MIYALVVLGGFCSWGAWANWLNHRKEPASESLRAIVSLIGGACLGAVTTFAIFVVLFFVAGGPLACYNF